MKKLFTTIFLTLSLILLLSGCSKNTQQENGNITPPLSETESTVLKDYTNKVADLRAQVFEKGQAVTQGLTLDSIEFEKGVAELEKLQSFARESYDQFRSIPVPKGGQELANSTRYFYETELQGLAKLTETLRNNKKYSKEAISALKGTLNDFAQREKSALSYLEQIENQIFSK
jgi:hypothetical protein